MSILMEHYSQLILVYRHDCYQIQQRLKYTLQQSRFKHAPITYADICTIGNETRRILSKKYNMKEIQWIITTWLHSGGGGIRWHYLLDYQYRWQLSDNDYEKSKDTRKERCIVNHCGKTKTKKKFKSRKSKSKINQDDQPLYFHSTHRKN